MEKIKEFMKKNWKMICIILGIIVLAVLAVVLIFAFSNNEEKKLTSELETLGKNFYESFYYDQIGSNDEERSKFLSKYSTIGIKVDLDNLSRTLDNKEEILKKFVNSKTKQECNKTNTKITIYPKDPYKKSDYKLEVILDCGFEKK